MRPIDADELYADIVQIAKVKAKSDAQKSLIGRILFVIEGKPTIKPEVRHGRWIPIEYDSYADGSPVWDMYECSECGHEHSGEEDTLTAFCPDCGADMRD